MSRFGGDYGESAIFEERDQRTMYAPSSRGSRRTREFDEVEVESRRSTRPARSVPDFLREDYNRDRTSAALVVREDSVDYDRPRRRPERERVEREEIIIKDEKRSAAPRARTVIEEDDVRSVRSGRTARTERTSRIVPRGESRTREEIDIKIRRDESEERPRLRERSTVREVIEDDVSIRRGDRDRSTFVERDDITFRRGDVERSRPRREETSKEEIIIRRNRSPSSSPSPVRRRRDSSLTSERIVFRPRERSLPPREGMIAREREEFIVRRRKPEPPSPSSSPSPPPPRRDEVKEEIIIRRTEREPSPPTPEPIIEPEPEPEPILETIRRPIIREEIHRDIITHYRNYDHGTEIVRREPTPPLILPPEPEPVKEEKLEVAIRRTDGDGETKEEIIIDERKGGRRHRDSRSRAGSVTSRRETIIEDDARSVTTRRDRSFSPARSIRDLGRHHHHHHHDEFDLAGEAEYYNRRALDRARIGEAYNGATRQWELVDVPPGTSRVKMDGIGGGGQEITWQGYNGARRSRFVADGQEFVGVPDFEERRERIRETETIAAPIIEPEPAPVVAEEKSKTLEITIRDRDAGGGSGALVRSEKRPKEMWTEVTKDLVTKEAIIEAGYGYEETDHYFYIMEYLKYDDVRALVSLSDEIHRRRKHRIKEMERERDYLERGPRRRDRDREFEEEIIYERRRR